jgi:hypothetical protein
LKFLFGVDKFLFHEKQKFESNYYEGVFGLVVVLDGVVVAAGAIEEPPATADGAVGQVHPQVGRQRTLGAHPIFGRNLRRVVEL